MPARRLRATSRLQTVSRLSLLSIFAALAAAAAPSACAPPRDSTAPTAAGVPSSAPPATSLAAADAAETAPLGRLPKDVRPLSSNLELTVQPGRDRFSGVTEITIELTKARTILWLHGKNLTVRRATVTPEGSAPLAATWEQAHESGVASIRLARAVGPGKATIRVEYDAPYGEGLHGLYKSSEAGVPYAFTQFEAIAAREAFPSFDEPVFKIPFTVTLVVAKTDKAIANTPEVERKDAPDGLVRVRFAPTEPIPSYLVAFAVGPFDVVEAKPVPPNAVRKRPLPLRGIAPKGRGKEFAYALAHTGEILATLEGYTGIEYPYAKLDIIAVPEKDGAMENPGAVTFKEYLLLMDEKTAPVRQKRAFAGVMAHELAHQWFGDLVTMPWWDDIWLNEAFATWMGNRATDLWDPSIKAEIDLLGGIQAAMSQDSLVSARQIRQPIKSPHDIANAFDQITYQKGGGVLTMFERWLGPETFQKGLHAYLEKHRFKTATSDDLMASLSEVSGKDVGTPFRTFLDQPGVPFVEVALTCAAGGNGKASLGLKQSRYFPLGSKGDPGHTWQIPFCARYDAKGEPRVSCTLLTEREGALPLEGESCPAWVMPNADAAGYFRFSLAPAELAKLRSAGMAKLTTREKMAFANSLRSAFARGTTPAKEVFETTAAFATEEHPALASEPGGYVGMAREWLAKDPLRTAVEAYGRSLYAPVGKELGWAPARGKKEAPETQMRRQDVLSFLAFTARDPAVRAEAAKRGRAYVGFGKDNKVHPEAVDSNLAGVALSVAGEEATPELFDAMLALLQKTNDDVVRGQLLGALGAAQAPALAKRARELALDPRLRITEVMSPLWAQASRIETREDTWTWVKMNHEALVKRLSSRSAARLAFIATKFCDEAHATDAQTFFIPRIDKFEGGPRTLASALEDIHLCVAKRAAHEAGTRAFFSAKAR